MPFVIGGTVVVLAIVVVLAVTGGSGSSSDSSANLKPGAIVAQAEDSVALIDFLGKYENLQPKYEALQTSRRKRFDLPKKQAK